jgi:hypothetical protein
MKERTMKKAGICCAVILLGLSACFLSEAGETAKDKKAEYNKWISDVLLEIQTVKVGMTREKVMKVFTNEGGLSGFYDQTIVYRDCPYIKVKVIFSPSGDVNDVWHMKDVLAEISQPYLATPSQVVD